MQADEIGQYATLNSPILKCKRDVKKLLFNFSLIVSVVLYYPNYMCSVSSFKSMPLIFYVNNPGAGGTARISLRVNCIVSGFYKLCQISNTTGTTTYTLKYHTYERVGVGESVVK